MRSTSGFGLANGAIVRGYGRTGRVRQRGVAVVTALLVTALAVTLVTDLFWQQQVQVRGMSGQRQRLQARLLLRGALDAATTTLRDAEANGGGGGGGGGGGAGSNIGSIDDDTAISQQIVDAQARFNLRNLVKGGAVDRFALASFARLLITLGDDPALAGVVAQAMQRAGAGAGPSASAVGVVVGGAPLVLAQLDDLTTLPGFTPAVLARLRSFVVLLPSATAINVNTAPAEVLTAVATLSLTEARVLVRQRQQAYFRDASDFALRLNSAQTLEGVSYAVSSDYFLVETAVRTGSTRLHAEALIARHPTPNSAPALLWVRET